MVKRAMNEDDQILEYVRIKAINQEPATIHDLAKKFHKTDYTMKIKILELVAQGKLKLIPTKKAYFVYPEWMIP